MSVSDRDGTLFVAGSDEAEQELVAGVVERSEADLMDDDEVVRYTLSMALPTVLSATAR